MANARFLLPRQSFWKYRTQNRTIAFSSMKARPLNAGVRIRGSHSQTTHPVIQKLLSANERWAEDTRRTDPDFFGSSCQGQTPKVLWIGCSDSRVPESVITAAKPGDIFVHRNVANQFNLSDDSAMAVLDFAIDVLLVEHVLVVGHTNCGGVIASLDAARSYPGTLPHSPVRPIDRWLAPLTDLAHSVLSSAGARPANELSITTDTGKHDEELAERLVYANVRVQVANVCVAEPVLRVWKTKTRSLWVHGLVYDVGSGRLKDLNISRGCP